MSTVLDPSNPNGGLMAGMLATYPGFTVSFPTASVLVQVAAGSGAPNSAALVTSQDGQYLRGFTNPLRTGDYSTSVVDPATGVAWLVRNFVFVGWGSGGEKRKKGKGLFCLRRFFLFFTFFLTHKKPNNNKNVFRFSLFTALGTGPDVRYHQ